jgi:hypothetical protein
VPFDERDPEQRLVGAGEDPPHGLQRVAVGLDGELSHGACSEFSRAAGADVTRDIAVPGQWLASARKAYSRLPTKFACDDAMRSAVSARAVGVTLLYADPRRPMAVGALTDEDEGGQAHSLQLLFAQIDYATYHVARDCGG